MGIYKRKQENKNSTKTVIKKKIKCSFFLVVFLFSWSLSWSSSFLFPCFLFFLLSCFLLWIPTSGLENSRPSAIVIVHYEIWIELVKYLHTNAALVTYPKRERRTDEGNNEKREGKFAFIQNKHVPSPVQSSA